MVREELPIPPHYDPSKVDDFWKVPYEQRAKEAQAWAEKHDIPPAAEDDSKICLIAIDVQNTFCLPDFELFVAGRSGTGAIDDNRRLCEFIYRNMDQINQIAATMDTHDALQIFHALFLINDDGDHPDPNTLVTREDIEEGRWRFNPAVADSLGINPAYGQRHLEHYVNELTEKEKYDLTIWPYHSMLGGIGHALVSSVEEALFFHSIARYSKPDFEIKGHNPLTEHYSALGPEVLTDPDGEKIGEKSGKFVRKLEKFDAVVIAGQAKSHCVAWTINDLLTDVRAHDESLVRKVYLLEDCTSPVVVPGVIDYTEEANAAFERFADAGMHIVQSTDPIETWPDIRIPQMA